MPGIKPMMFGSLVRWTSGILSAGDMGSRSAGLEVDFALPHLATEWNGTDYFLFLFTFCFVLSRLKIFASPASFIPFNLQR